MAAPSEPGRYSGLTLDPSETRAAVVKQADRATADQDLWLLELSQSRPSRLTFDARLEESPVWSHDGSRVFFNATGTAGSLFEQSLSGTDAAPLLQTGDHNIPTSASSDGRFLLYTVMSPRATRFDLWVLPLKGDRKPFPFVRREFDQLQGQFSPDGRWVAYVSNESGRHEVLVRPFTPAGAADAVESSVVSKGGGTSPRWGANGKELYYLAPNGTVTSVAFATDRGVPTGPQRVLFQVPGADADWAVTRDGERLSSRRACRPQHAVAVHGRLQLAGGCESIVAPTVGPTFSGRASATPVVTAIQVRLAGAVGLGLLFLLLRVDAVGNSELYVVSTLPGLREGYGRKVAQLPASLFATDANPQGPRFTAVRTVLATRVP